MRSLKNLLPKFSRSASLKEHLRAEQLRTLTFEIVAPVHAFTLASNLSAGYEHQVDQIVAELLACLDNPFLAMLQWDEVFSVVEVSSFTLFA